MTSDPSPTPSHPRARRTGLTLLTVLVALAGVVLLLLFLQGRDRSQVTGGDPAATSAPGQPFAGPELPAEVPPASAGARPGDEQILASLERGNVVLVYAAARQQPALDALARTVAGPPDPALAASGQAVELVRRPGTSGIVALAWGRVLRVQDAEDPQLEAFAAHWLGRGAG